MAKSSDKSGAAPSAASSSLHQADAQTVQSARSTGERPTPPSASPETRGAYWDACVKCGKPEYEHGSFGFRDHEFKTSGVNEAAPPLARVTQNGERHAENSPQLDRQVGDAGADTHGADGGDCSPARGGSSSRDGGYDDTDIDAGIGAIYNTTRLPNIHARELAQHVRQLIEASRSERLAAPPSAGVTPPQENEAKRLTDRMDAVFNEE